MPPIMENMASIAVRVRPAQLGPRITPDIIAGAQVLLYNGEVVLLCRVFEADETWLIVQQMKRGKRLELDTYKPQGEWPHVVVALKHVCLIKNTGILTQQHYVNRLIMGRLNNYLQNNQPSVEVRVPHFYNLSEFLQMQAQPVA